VTPEHGCAGGSAPLLELDGIAAAYGHVRALWDVSLSVREGEIVTLLGANGAGKTTTMRVISGVLRPERGEVRIAGRPIQRLRAPQIVGAGVVQIPEGRHLWPRMTVTENLELGAFAPRGRAVARETIASVLSLFPRLAERRTQLAGTLSGGEQQMLAIGRGLMSRPRLLMLDEPSLGLAPAVVESMYETFGRLHREGLTILLAEQSIELALEVSDFATVLQVGKSVLSGTAAALAQDPQVQKAYLGTA